MNTIHRIDPNISFELVGTFSHAVEESAREEMLAEFVEQYDEDFHGSISSYAVQSSFDVYSARYGDTKARLEFRAELKARLRDLQRRLAAA